MNQIKRFMLRALARMSGEPMPQSSLFDAVSIALPPRPMRSDLDGALRDLEADGYIIGTHVDLVGPCWLLTDPKGELKAKQLG